MKPGRENNGRPGAAAADAADTAVAVDTADGAKVASEEATDESRFRQGVGRAGFEPAKA